MVISARISVGAKCVRISFGFDAKSLSKWGSLKKTTTKNTKYWHLTWGKKHYFFAAYLNGVSLKMGWTRGSNPAAKSLDSGARVTLVDGGDTRWTK